MTNLARLCFVFATITIALLADDSWLKKPFTAWSSKEASKLLTNSPWSHSVTIGGGAMDEPGRAVSGGNPAAIPSDDSMTGAAIGAGGPGNPGSRPDGNRGSARSSVAAGVPVTVHVRWLSALPVRRALVIARLGRDKLDSEQSRKFLEQTPGYYVVAVAGLPSQMVAAISEDRLTGLAKSATLLRKDKDPIVAESAQKLTDEPGVAFLFPKTSAITLDDKEIEFVSKAGAIELKTKFKLKDMLLAGKLEI